MTKKYRVSFTTSDLDTVLKVLEGSVWDSEVHEINAPVIKKKQDKAYDYQRRANGPLPQLVLSYFTSNSTVLTVSDVMNKLAEQGKNASSAQAALSALKCAGRLEQTGIGTFRRKQ